ncbi:MAG: hypothetical protein LBT76_00600 [Tannerella sp.]|jgi:hypothetical protein|nr:hypothetical protein [Tannerella sp.]
MEKRMHDMVRLFVANGYGFGKYRAGYIFAKTLKDDSFFYLTKDKMAVLSSSMDEEDEKQTVIAAGQLAFSELAPYFQLDSRRISRIDWLCPVNVILLCEKAETVRSQLLYYTWPAVALRFTAELSENTLVIYDRFTPPARLEFLRREAAANRHISDSTEYWSMLKLLAIGDRFGELAPKVCMETVLNQTHK